MKGSTSKSKTTSASKGGVSPKKTKLPERTREETEGEASSPDRKSETESEENENTTKDSEVSSEEVDEIDDEEEEEAHNKASSFQPPKDFVEHQSTVKTKFDAASLGDDTELWLIRIPNTVSIEKLEGLTVKLPQTKQSDDTQPLAKLDNGKFGLFARDEDTSETDGLGCLLPNKKRGGLTFASKPFSRFLTVNAVASLPDATAAAEEILSRVPSPPKHPEGLKMRFKPYGFDTGAPAATATKRSHDESAMEVDTPETPRKSAKKEKGKKSKAADAEEGEEDASAKKKKKKKEKKHKSEG
ncbi:uncharacterized protein VTP21DRAFT_7829 [Calcarisporiella thermophila]|uniref:uncharacterized protein n=1 Tax=Calcarisporiella thermophila TaxID=911321 RepID=UPI003741F106